MNKEGYKRTDNLSAIESVRQSEFSFMLIRDSCKVNYNASILLKIKFVYKESVTRQTVEYIGVNKSGNIQSLSTRQVE